MNWTPIDKELPVEWPFCMDGFATVKEPGYPKRVLRGMFMSLRELKEEYYNPPKYNVKNEYLLKEDLKFTTGDVVFLEDYGYWDKDEAHHYGVYPQQWITAWMPFPKPYSPKGKKK